MLKNTLGTILDKGPVIVTEEESYLGESLFENTMMQVSGEREGRIKKGGRREKREEGEEGRGGMDNFLIATQEEHKLLPYSVNLECKVSKTSSSSQKPKRTTVRAGMICITKIIERKEEKDNEGEGREE